MLSKGPPLQAFVSHFSSLLLLPIRAVKTRAIATWGNLKQHGSELINKKEQIFCYVVSHCTGVTQPRNHNSFINYNSQNISWNLKTSVKY